MAGARAAVGRRKASAPLPTSPASEGGGEKGARRIRDAAQHLRLSALCLPLFFWRRTLRGVRLQSSDADVSRERDRSHHPPPLSRWRIKIGAHWQSQNRQSTEGLVFLSKIYGRANHAVFSISFHRRRESDVQLVRDKELATCRARSIGQWAFGRSGVCTSNVVTC